MHKVMLSPAQVARLQRDRDAWEAGRQPFPQRVYLGWRYVASVKAAENALRELLDRHPLLRSRIDAGVLGLAGGRGALRIPASKQSYEDFVRELSFKQAQPTRPGSPVCEALIKLTEHGDFAGIIVDHLVCDTASLQILSREFDELIQGGPSTSSTPDRHEESCELQWQALRLPRKEAVSLYRTPLYDGLIATPLPGGNPTEVGERLDMALQERLLRLRACRTRRGTPCPSATNIHSFTPTPARVVSNSPKSTSASAPGAWTCGTNTSLLTRSRSTRRRATYRDTVTSYTAAWCSAISRCHTRRAVCRCFRGTSS